MFLLHKVCFVITFQLCEHTEGLSSSPTWAVSSYSCNWLFCRQFFSLSLFLSIHFVLLVFLFPVVGPNQTIQKYVVILKTNQTMLSLIMTENSFHRGSAVCGLRCEVQLFVICVKGPYNSPLTTVLECTKWFQMVHRVAVNSEFICIK